MVPLPAPLTPLGARTPLAHPALYGVIAVLSLVVIAGAAWIFWPRSAVPPTPQPSPSARVEPSGTPVSAPTQTPRCVSIEGAATVASAWKDAAWVKPFTEQILPGWTLQVVCENTATNQVGYLKSFTGDGNDLQPLYQFGTYSVALDRFDKSPTWQAPLYGGCDIASWKGSAVSMTCGGGDAGIRAQDDYTFDIRTKALVRTRSCTTTDASEDCGQTNVALSGPWRIVDLGAAQPSVPGVSLALPPSWPRMPAVANNLHQDGLAGAGITQQSIYYAALGPIGPYLEGSVDSPYHIGVYEQLDYDAVLSGIWAHRFPTGDYSAIKTGTLNGMRVISYTVGGLCSGPEAILFGTTRTVVISSYCVDENKDQFDGIVPTVRISQ